MFRVSIESNLLLSFYCLGYVWRFPNPYLLLSSVYRIPSSVFCSVGLVVRDSFTLHGIFFFYFQL